MSEPVTPPAAVSSPAPVAAPVPVLSTAELIAMAEKLDENTVASLVRDGSATPPGEPVIPVPVTPIPVVAPVTPVAAPAVTPAPVVAPVPPVEEEPSPEKLGKFRVQAKDFKEAELLRHMKTMTAEEAIAKVYPNRVAPAPAAVEPPAAPEAAPVTPAPNAAADAIKAEIAKLEAESDKAADDMDPKTANKLNRQIMDKKADLRQIEAQAVAEARHAEQSKANQAETNFQQLVTESAKTVYAARPSLADKASPERVEFDAFVNLKFGDPRYTSLFDAPVWPEMLYLQFAEAKGWGKAVAPAAAPALPVATPSATAAPRVTSAEVLTPGETPGGAPVNAAQLIADVKNLSVAQIDAILAKV